MKKLQKKGKKMRTKKIPLLLALLLSGVAFAAQNNPEIAYYPFVKENVEMPQLVNNAYAYAPATVYYNGQYHQFYCSSGNLTDRYFQVPKYGEIRMQESWDHIRYRSSKNGSVWSSPSIAIMQAPKERQSNVSRTDDRYKEYENADPKIPYFFPTKGENCACDPAIVKGDDGYWYMLYAGNIDNYNTTLFLARSLNIQGPYEKYYGDGWDRWTYRPTPLLGRRTNHPANDASIYGIGQPTIVKKDGKIHVWFAEMNNVKFTEAGKLYSRRYHVVVNQIGDLGSIDLTYPSKSKYKIDTLTHNEKNFLSDTAKWPMVDFGEVRWNVKNDRYEMWILEKGLSPKEGEEQSRIKKFYSRNAVNWYRDRSYNEGPYNYINNIGVSGDSVGWVYGDQYLLSFCAPTSYQFNRAQMISNGYIKIVMKDGVEEVSKFGVGFGMWPMWQKLNGMEWTRYNVTYNEKNSLAGIKYQDYKNMKFFVGDFDGDGVDELGAVDTSSSKWYLGSSRNTSDKKSSIWGKSYAELSTKGKYKIVTGDYDGDGITDIGVVNFKKENGIWSGYWNVRSSKKNGSIGVPFIPKNWKWGGLTENHILLNGDYDGDGIVDRGAFWPGDKTVYFISSMDNYEMNYQKITKTQNAYNVSLWGFPIPASNLGNAMPIVGDFDGDHIADVTVVDVNTNLWYILSSQTGGPMISKYKVKNDTILHSLNNWPLYMMRTVNSQGVPSKKLNTTMSDYKFLAGDFDGDGVDDQLAIHPTSGSGYMLLSRTIISSDSSLDFLNGVRPEIFPRVAKLNSKEILVGDFNGDGLSDVCIVDLESNSYYIYFFERDENTGKISKKTSVSRPIKYVRPASGSLKKESPRVQEENQEPISTKPVRNIAIRVQKMLLNVSNLFDGDDVIVMDVRGKEIARKTAHGTEVNIVIPARGAYIVRAGETNRLISVK